MNDAMWRIFEAGMSGLVIAIAFGIVLKIIVWLRDIFQGK